ncbi:D-cysteine desulfhydrase family protein [Spartinivicinus poritis]|uniref:D-cysteine desulfhydrase family protein n=1 Tax=Spartinivicinus poritis TaxID=2994640 RepID=A0ABT5U8G3_9GAMM|nr:D-cysteine desulfhydrase family protein [Spartinivicinus sp. A2-2]MDE1462654.1 D-cysteine desulfhydrase family protein [Spartinivicinus sp. A2-2]
MLTQTLPRTSLGFFPTPVVELKQLSNQLKGPRIFIKRDDQTGLALGGNKTRKLEYLVADALQQGCDTLVTAGAPQSNHCRQTAAAAALMGLDCHLVLGGEATSKVNGNLLLDRLLGANIHWSGEQRKGEQIPQIIDALTKQGKKPYEIPYGGSNAVGAAAFVFAVEELSQQQCNLDIEFDHIVFASSSGGTHAGLTVGKSLLQLNTQIIGIGIDKGEAGELPYTTYLTQLSNETHALVSKEQAHYTESDFFLNTNYQGAGYGVVGDLERDAIQLVAQTEGILLDPVYTGRAMGALIDMIRNKQFDQQQTVLFWHTGGAPALFDYADELTRDAL